MVKMVNNNKNTIFEKIKQATSLTDKELFKSITKDGLIISEPQFEKTLLELEISGVITVSWLTKDTRRIEIITQKEDDDEYDEQIKVADQKSYEASFPGTENGI